MPGPEQAKPKEHSQTMHHCIKACQQAMHQCMESVDYSLSRGGVDHSFIHLLLSAAEAAQANVRFMVVNSPYFERTCELCQEVCHRCAQQCIEDYADDAMLTHCARICNLCVEACQRLLESMAYHKRAA